jgi:hypothetical protein
LYFVVSRKNFYYPFDKVAYQLFFASLFFVKKTLKNNCLQPCLQLYFYEKALYRIPTDSELINQTSICVDDKGRPYIVSYWRPQGTKIPQYHLIYYDGKEWRLSQITQRATPFSLSGGGTKRIPISRPQILVSSVKSKLKAFMVFRDSERGNRVSVAICTDLNKQEWLIKDLTEDEVGIWEPTFDQALWNKKKELHLFVQKVGQGDAESIENVSEQMVSILEWIPEKL